MTVYRPTARESWLVEQAKKAFENAVPALNDYLGRLLTLTTALTGAGFLAAKGEVMPRGFVVATLLVLLFAVAASAFGLKPISCAMQSPFVNAREYDAFERRVIARKLACVWAAGVALLVALLVAVAGLAVG